MLEEVHEVHQTLIISFQESIKIALLTAFFQSVIFLKLQKKGRMTCPRWVSEVTPAGQLGRRKNHQKWVGWGIYRANSAGSMFPTGGKT